MTKKFITYGSHVFVQSAKRIIGEAKSLHIFTETQRYSYADLPFALKASPLFVDKKKGGFWLWKAYIIYDSLSKLKDNDILVYADSGCELKNAHLWQSYFDQLRDNHAIFFQYSSEKNYGWKDFNKNFTNSPKIKYWTKKTTVDHFRTVFGNDDQWLEKNKLLAGFMIIRKTKESLQMIKDWLDMMVYMPHLVVDPLLSESGIQNEGFSAHRHDQSILSIIVRHYERKISLHIIDEKSEGDYPDQIVKASRRIDKTEDNNFTSFAKKIYYKIKK